MKFRHFAFAFAVFPLVGLSYACSKSNSHSGDNPGNTGEPSPDGSDADDIIDGGGDADTGVNGDTDTTGAGDTDTGVNSDTDTGSTGDTDPGDPGSHLVKCVGNPLAGDGTAPVFTPIRNELVAPFGPRYVEIGGKGQLIYSVHAQLIRVNPDGNEPATIFTGTVGNVFHGNAIEDGTILTADPTGVGTGFILQTKFDGTNSGSISTAPSTRPYALAVGPKGDLYFTDYPGASETGGVYRISPTPEHAVTRTSLPYGSSTQEADIYTNNCIGIALSPDADKLYVVTLNMIVAWMINDDGSLATPHNQLATTSNSVAAIAVDTGGNLWVGEAASTNSLIEVFAPDGTRYGAITLPVEAGTRPTGIAFGGEDNQTVFITMNNGGVWTYQASCAGIR